MAPTLSLAIMAAVGVLLFWYWRGGSAMTSVTLSPEAISAASDQYPVPGSRPRISAANQGLLAKLGAMLGAAATRPVAAGLKIPPLRIANLGAITQARVGGPINIAAGPYTLVATPNGRGRPGFHYRFTVRADAAFGPDDAALFRVAYQIVNTKVGQQESGAPPELIAGLKSTFGNELRSPTLQVPPGQMQALDRLWLEYLTTPESGRQDSAVKLLDAIAALGPKAMAADQDSLTTLAASVRQMLPPSQAQAYGQAMSEAAARSTTRPPATQPAY
jgi:hypothetical protein